MCSLLGIGRAGLRVEGMRSYRVRVRNRVGAKPAGNVGWGGTGLGLSLQYPHLGEGVVPVIRARVTDRTRSRHIYRN